MRIHARLRRKGLAAALATAVVAQLAISAGEASAGETPLWQVEVAKIPTAEYVRDARLYITEATQALRPYVGDGLGSSRIDPVLADVGSRYFDGARLENAADGEVAFDNLRHLESFLKSRMTGASPPNGEAEQAHVRALVETLTGVRLLADAAIQDAEATIGPFRASPPPAPAPAGLTEAFADLAAAKVNLAKADEMLLKANPEPATIQAANAWRNGFNVLVRLGITYDGDHDADGVVDVVELRLGASPLLVDSDGDKLTDKFEITELTGWAMPNAVDTDRDSVADGAEDVDGDGLTNLDEQRLGTSPTDPDTDGDGATDGAEVAKGSNPLVADQPRAPPTPGDVPPIVPAPNLDDTDGDGLIDIAEGEILTDINNVDSDGDGLSDGTEVNDWGINPLGQDSDGDGLRDDYEVAHVQDQSLDPGRPDEQISKWTYVSDFALGLVAGEFAMRDSMAWLAGNVCSGALSLIPVVGWIVGAITDIRDAVAAAIRGDWVSAGFSVVGLIPYAGDAVAIPAKVAKFALRYLHRMDAVVRFVTRYDKLTDAVKDIALELILGETYNYLQSGDTSFNFMALAATSRFSDADIRTLSKGDRTKWKSIEEAMKLPNHRPGVPVPPQWNFTAGEEYLKTILSNCLPQHQVNTPGYPRAGSKWRKADCAEVDDIDGSVTLHEVKTGVPTWTESLIDECLKDAWIPTDEAKNVHGQRNIKKVHWHFFASASYNSIGVHPPLLECLKNNNIDFTIHAPSGA
ncbi:hypothetical protein ACLQ3A_17820 [Micromonospora zamorensis]|uniref:hypothetical protein n=1 Tax=Micromonospora zamorensis TaxID=709883 RepID=UPI00081FB5CB|nr:hypothetical protein [Micromonospora zamorensis]WSK49680.1 hypothetical protein OG423_04435 [Micromonospora zamorensis]WTE87652.1 hypothetical protein OHA01_02855 [Micromonospora zamorensis]SCG56848.1 hypothetical protein GA0070619_3508 [Micromonospora zamorensis]